MISLIANYLDNRQQCVYSKKHDVRSPIVNCDVGVPQGTLLGPTLWLAFVDSLQFATGSTIKYADDTTSYFPLTKSDNMISATTAATMSFDPPSTGQTLIDECSRWSNDNRMTLNTAKTKVMNISLRKTLSMTSNYSIDGSHDVEVVENSKLLGVHLDSHLSFNHHIKSVKQTANRKCHGFLVLKKAGVNSDSLLIMYRSRILPSITHSAPAWYPYTTIYQRDILESIQRLALRIMLPEYEDYNERLLVTNMRTLCDELDNICSEYVTKVLEHSNHQLHHRIPKRRGERYSRRLSSSDIYIKKSRTVKCNKSILKNAKYFQVS